MPQFTRDDMERVADAIANLGDVKSGKVVVAPTVTEYTSWKEYSHAHGLGINSFDDRVAFSGIYLKEYRRYVDGKKRTLGASGGTPPLDPARPERLAYDCREFMKRVNHY